MDTYRNGNTALGPTRSPSTRINDNFFEQLLEAVPGAQLNWLREELLNATASCDAVLVVGHHAVFSGGQHGQSARQQDLKDRLAFPAAFTYAGVDAYLNGHDHIVEALEANGTRYFVTGAGSDVRFNNVPTPESRFLLEDNGFTVHSFNATHVAHGVVHWNGSLLYTVTVPLLSKLRSGRALPPPAAAAWLLAPVV
jgi:tartrate-resistant acid phosphatase type 5